VKYVDFGATYFKVAFIRTRSSVNCYLFLHPFSSTRWGGGRGWFCIAGDGRYKLGRAVEIDSKMEFV